MIAPVPTRAASPLDRLRALFGVLALSAVAATAAPLTAAGDPATVAAGLTAAAVLAGVYVLGLRRGAFPAALEPVELVAAAVLVALAPGHSALLLVALLFRCLYGGPAPAALRTAGAVAILAVDAVVDGHDVVTEASRALGLVLGGVLVTWLRGALDAADRTQRLLRAVAEQSTDVTCIVGVDLTVRWLGASAHARFAITDEGLVGRPATALVHPADAERFEWALRLLEPGAHHTLVSQLRDVDGKLRWVEAAVANRTDDPVVEGFIVHLRDVTDRRRLEDERQALVRERERVAEQRSRQELEARLQRSERLGSVGQLAGGIAHDFNNLLGVILNFARFIREDLPPGSASGDDLDQIEHAARRGADLTRQLLVFSQRRLTHAEVVDLNGLVDSLDRLLSASLSERVLLELTLHEAPVRVEIDPGHAEQVLVNLVVNARDALAGGGGTISVGTCAVELGEQDAAALELVPGRYAVVAVRDDGCGMDPVTAARALEPFFTTKPSGQGTGLGLATVASIAEGAGGAVQLESAPGRGTTVSVFLPLSSARVAARPAAEPPAPAPARAARGRVLLVEDEDGVRALVERLLEAFGFDVVATASGEEALDTFGARGPFDALVTDVVMPGMSGIELVDRLREGGAELPVLLMSGYSEELLATEGAGDPVLPKPFDGDALEAAMAGLLPASAPAAA